MADIISMVAENAANIGMLAMSLIKDGKIEVGSQINLALDIAGVAQEFERKYEEHDWNETGDYNKTIDAFAEKWLLRSYAPKEPAAEQTAEPKPAVATSRSGKVHVATVCVNGSDLAAVYEPLGHALAPLGFLITPFVQEANYLNAARYNGKMSQLQFVDLLMCYLPVPAFGLTVLAGKVDGRVENLKVYATEDVFCRSTYAAKDFLVHVWKSELPIIFRS